MVSMTPELGETLDELSELSSLVKKIETAQLESRPLSSDEATALDVAFSKTNLRELCQAKLADSAKSELCSLAHRIWAAVGQGPPYDQLQDAKCRNLACNIFSASFRGCIPPSDALLLSAHWAFSGQAWMRADASSPFALPCFAEAAKAWRSQPSVKLAQVAAQALLWAGEAHFRQVSYTEAFSQLSQARDIICSYQDWDGMLDNFLRVCFEQANAHRGAGNLSEAIELLNLAIAAGPNAAPAAKCRLLRALALCHISGVEGLAHAKQAVALSPTSKDRVLSLQVLLELLLGESALETSRIPEAQMAAVSLAKEPEAPLSMCLELCELLTERQLLEAVDSVLHALKLRKDLSGQSDQCKVLLLYSLRNAADAILAAKSPQGCQRLNKVVADFEAVGETRTDSAKEICCDGGRLLWSLAGKLWNDGKKGDAARWIKKSAELLSAGQSMEAASCWLAAGKSFQLAGHMDSALACVRKAASTDEADAILHLLELSCEQLKAGGESSEAWSCVEKLGKNPNLWRSQAARAAKATLEQPSEDLRLAGLELFVMCTAKDSQSDLSGLTMAAQLLSRMVELQRPVEDLRRLLRHAASISAACGAESLRDVEDGRPLAALRQLLATAWSKGQEFGESLQWSSAAWMFEAGHQILEILETVDPTEAVDSARVRDFIDVRIWFLVMDASARVQQAKDPNDPESLRYALTCLQNAHRLRRQSQELQAKGIHGQVPCSSTTWCQRRFLIMVLLEFEVRCLLGDPEQELRKFVDMAAKAEDLGARSLLAMSKIAAATSCRRLAFHCLKQYLCGLVSGGVLDFKQALPAYREMLSLNSCKNDSLPIFEGILNILGGSGNSKDPQYPKDEVKWLVATAWNTGAQFFRMQQYKWAERWMSKALALAKFCPGSFPPEKMTEGYAACLKHCA